MFKVLSHQQLVLKDEKLEPSTTGLKGREADDSHAGPSPMLEPGDSRQFDLNFIFESGK